MQPYRNETPPENIIGDFTKPILVKAEPGEVICEACGLVITPDQLSADPKKRAYEEKWHLHEACHDRTNEEIDRFSGEENRFAKRTHDVVIDKGTIATEKF